MKILHISDTHSCHRRLRDLPEADVLVHSGDLTMTGSESEAIDFLNWLCDMPYAHKIFKKKISSLKAAIPMLGTSGLILLAGRPAQGKSALMFSLAREAAVDKNIPTAIFSLEMETQTCLNRMIGAILSIELHDIKTGKVELNEEDIPESFNSAPLFIDDTPCLSVENFKRKAAELVNKEGVRLIFIDYLWLMTASENWKDFSNREEELQEILQSLKAITAELDVSIVALAQLNKSLRVQGQYTPNYEDLKLTSPLSLTIPDVVCIIHRPRYYTSPEARKSTEPEQTELILVKNPCCETGTIEMSFNPQYCRFENQFL